MFICDHNILISGLSMLTAIIGLNKVICGLNTVNCGYNTLISGLIIVIIVFCIVICGLTLLKHYHHVTLEAPYINELVDLLIYTKACFADNNQNSHKLRFDTLN